MKTKTSLSLFTGMIFLLSFNYAKAQVAGNWMYNQSMQAEQYNDDYSFDVSKSVEYPVYQTGINDTVIVLETNAMMNVKADSYIAIFGVSQVSDSIESGHRLINNRLNSFIKSISKLGIKSDDIYIDFISQVPIFEYELEKKLFSKTYNEIPKGFELKKNIHINYEDKEIIDKLLIEAAKNEIYDIVKVDYIINDIESVYDSLRNVSIKLMNKKEKEFKNLNIKFIPMYHTVSENITSNYPIERYSSYTAFNKPSINAVYKSSGKVIRSSSTTPITIYYNKIPYNNYDIVINPTVIEPVVQFSYNLKVKYVLKRQ